MTIHSAGISVTAPVGLALDRVKRILFRPFHLGKWFVIGFCAWLAGLGESGGNFNASGHSGGGGPPGGARSFRDLMDQAVQYAMQNLYWIIPVVAAVLVLGLAWGILVTWLSSRGKFMFLYCVALDQAEVKRPWHEFVREGNSLFWFRFVLGLIGMCLFLPLLGSILFILLRMLYRDNAEAGGIVLAVGLGLAFLALAVCFWLIHKFTMDFVVPIMFLRRAKCTIAWGEFLGLLGANAGHFTLYVLFQFVLAIAIGFLLLVVVVVTCCIAGCLMALPYLGTVALLPVLVFERSYSLCYLAQFVPAYDVFSAQAARADRIAGLAWVIAPPLDGA
jgi:hypothetical protein